MWRTIQDLMHRRLPEGSIEHFDSEPRSATFSSVFPGGPPPPYRSFTSTEDGTSTSECSTSTATEKRRSSRSNFMTEDSPDNVNAYSRKPYNGYYPPAALPSSRTSSITGQSSASEFVLMPIGSLYKLNESGAPPERHVETVTVKRDRMESLRRCWSKTWVKLLVVLLILLLIAAIVLAIVLPLTLGKGRKSFNWLPPLQYRMGQENPSKVAMKSSGDQVRFELTGNIPFKGDSVAVYDFRSRKVALIDSTLKNNGKNLVCFVMNLNSTTMPSKELLENAAKNSVDRKEQLQGWDESWNVVPGPYFGNPTNLFSSNISECESARWIELNYTVIDQKGQKCTECHDFCMPEYGVEQDQIRGESYLNIVRRVCFNLFVPEWRSFAQAYSNEQNQRDFESYYKNTNGIAGVNRASSAGAPNSPDRETFESKWISLQQVPQRISNLTHQAVDTFNSNVQGVQGAFMGAAQSVFGNNPTNPQNGNVGNGNAPRSYSNGQGSMGMGLTNEQAQWESGRPQGIVGIPQQQYAQSGMPVQQGPINLGLPPISSNQPRNGNPDSSTSGYQSMAGVYSSQPQNGYSNSPSGYVPNVVSNPEPSSQYTNGNSHIRQVSNSYGSGQPYGYQSSYRPVDINNPMNGVNGNGYGAYSNQHTYGGGTNFPVQAYVNNPRDIPSQFMQQSPSGYRPEIPDTVYTDNNQRFFLDRQGSQNNGQSWMNGG